MYVTEAVWKRIPTLSMFMIDKVSNITRYTWGLQ